MMRRARPSRATCAASWPWSWRWRHVWLTQRVCAPLAGWLFSPWFGSDVARGSLHAKWIDLLALVLGIAVTLPLAAFAARKARFETLLSGLEAYFSQPRAWSFLGFIVFYKLSDAFALSLMTPFLLKGMAFGPAEVGVDQQDLFS